MKTKTTDYTALLNGYFGRVNQTLTLADGRELVETHIADPSEDWECAEWYLDGQRICICDGYNGREWEKGFKPTDEIDELVTSYEVSGLLAEAKAAATEEAEETDTDVRILVRPEYYEGQNKPVPHILTGREADPDDDQNDDEHIFATYQEAADWISAAEAGTYYLAHNEAGRPDYTIIK